MSNQESSKEIIPIIIRKSALLFILRIILLELTFEVIYLTWRGLIHLLPVPLETLLTLNLISILFFLIVSTILQNIILVYIALRWINDYYEIRPYEIATVSGILFKIEKSYPYQDIQSITIHQGLLARILGYGSVHLYIPTLGHDLIFNEVSNPDRFIEMIKSANPKIEGGKYIFRR